jgi:hypothetical protein
MSGSADWVSTSGVAMQPNMTVCKDLRISLRLDDTEKSINKSSIGGLAVEKTSQAAGPKRNHQWSESVSDRLGLATSISGSDESHGPGSKPSNCDVPIIEVTEIRVPVCVVPMAAKEPRIPARPVKRQANPRQGLVCLLRGLGSIFKRRTLLHERRQLVGVEKREALEVEIRRSYVHR